MNRDLSERVENAIKASGALKGLADFFKNLLVSVFHKTPLRPIKLFFNGTWVEHPLHAVLVDVPLGAWTAVILLDLVALLFGVQGLEFASGLVLGLGTLAALGAIIAGLMDYMDTLPPIQSVAFTHGVTNILATALFAISFFLRLGGGWAITLDRALFSIFGYLVVLAGSFLGGHMVFRQGALVNQNAFRVGPKEFVNVMAVKELPENQPRRVDVQGSPVLLIRRGQEIFAIGAVCSHLGGPLEKGELDGDTIECPLHDSRFLIRDGSVKAGPATSPVPAYETRTQDGQLQVRLKK